MKPRVTSVVGRLRRRVAGRDPEIETRVRREGGVAGARGPTAGMRSIGASQSTISAVVVTGTLIRDVGAVEHNSRSTPRCSGRPCDRRAPPASRGNRRDHTVGHHGLRAHPGRRRRRQPQFSRTPPSTITTAKTMRRTVARTFPVGRMVPLDGDVAAEEGAWSLPIWKESPMRWRVGPMSRQTGAKERQQIRATLALA